MGLPVPNQERAHFSKFHCTTEAMAEYTIFVDKLVAGTIPQHRVTKLSPRPASGEDLKQLFLDSLKLW
jgi:hydroxyacid-oxoacid transhydrogenase